MGGASQPPNHGLKKQEERKTLEEARSRIKGEKSCQWGGGGSHPIRGSITKDPGALKKKSF